MLKNRGYDVLNLAAGGSTTRDVLFGHAHAMNNLLGRPANSFWRGYDKLISKPISEKVKRIKPNDTVLLSICWNDAIVKELKKNRPYLTTLSKFFNSYGRGLDTNETFCFIL
eukprot:UN28403